MNLNIRVLLLIHIIYVIMMGALLNGLLFKVGGFGGGMSTPLIYLFMFWVFGEVYLYSKVLDVSSKKVTPR